MFAVFAVCTSIANAEEPVYDFDIPSQDAASSLEQLADITGAIGLFRYDLAAAQQANAVVGRYTLPDALNVLLEGTTLVGDLSEKRVISISQFAEAERPKEEEAMQAVKTPLRTKIGAAIAGLFVVTGATAQEDGTVEEIVVIGTHLQNQRAIDARRNSFVVIDAVTSDDVGRLPDFNVGEALQRLPGISIQNDQAEARFVTVRALNADYNYTTVDGVSIAVPDRNGRKVFMDLLPASLAERIEVQKTFTPNMDANAIGGIVNIVTTSAFNRSPGQITFNTEFGQYENDGGFRDVGGSGTADIQYSNIFGANEQYGLVLSANYYLRDSVIPQGEFGSSRAFYDAAGNAVGTPNDPPYSGNGYPVLTERGSWYYHNTRERYGATAKFEIRPSDEASYFIRAFYNQADDDEARQNEQLIHSGGQTIQNQTATSGTILTSNSLRQRVRLGLFDFERSVSQLVAGGDLQFASGELSFRLNYSGSTFKNLETFHEWRLQGDNDGDGVDDNAFDYEQRGDEIIAFPLDQAAYTDLTNFNFHQWDVADRDLDEDIYEAKLDWSDALGSSDNWRYGVGLSYRTNNREYTEVRDRINPTATNTFTLAAANNVYTDRCLTAPGFAGQCFTALNPGATVASFDADLAANPADYNFDPRTNDDNDENYELDEDVFALYFMFQYSSDQSDLILGARYEDTSNDGLGYRDVSGTGWVPVTNSGGYDHLLPSINYKYRISDDLIFRASYSQTIGRGEYQAIAPVGESLDEVNLTLRRSNPDLKPRESSNYDLGLDYYFDDGDGLVAANLFYKVVENEIFTATESLLIDLDGDGSPEDVTVTQPVNNGMDTNILGLELQAIKNLGNWIPGLGVSGNVTFLETDFQVLMNDGTFVQLQTMVGQPKVSYNAAVFFDGDRFSAKLAYTYQGEKKRRGIRTTQEYRHRYENEEYSLDFKASYRFTDRWAATLNVWNLADNGRSETIGFDQELPMLVAGFGRAVFLGVSFNNQ